MGESMISDVSIALYLWIVNNSVILSFLWWSGVIDESLFSRYDEISIIFLYFFKITCSLDDKK